jgi:hypothetical protein
MPDIVMHHYFGREVINELEDRTVSKIKNIELYDFATAGPDPFFFVSFFKMKKNIISREFGNYMHRHKSREFFLELIEQTKINHGLFPYLSGFVCHYYLDVVTHPYVFYYTGVYDKHDPSTCQYRGLHTRLERAMDSYVIKSYYSSPPEKFKIHKVILKQKGLDKHLKYGLDILYKNVYDHDNAYEHICKSIKDQRKFYKFIYDPRGFKNILLSKLDNGQSSLDLSFLSYYGKSIEDIDIFNLEHRQWLNPVDKNIISEKTFFELFTEAKQSAITTINALYAHIFDGENNNVGTHFKNSSYLTGINCDLDNEMINFQNIFKI